MLLLWPINGLLRERIGAASLFVIPLGTNAENYLIQRTKMETLKFRRMVCKLRLKCCLLFFENISYVSHEPGRC